jgi:hypothetical protein
MHARGLHTARKDMHLCPNEIEFERSLGNSPGYQVCLPKSKISPSPVHWPRPRLFFFFFFVGFVCLIPHVDLEVRAAGDLSNDVVALGEESVPEYFLVNLLCKNERIAILPVIEDALLLVGQIRPLGDRILGLHRRLCEATGRILTGEDWMTE